MVEETVNFQPISTPKKNITSSFFDPYYNNILSVDFKNDEYNIITLWHVLEHVYDLDVLFQNIGKSLKNKGKLVVAVPNFDSLEKIYIKKIGQLMTYQDISITLIIFH